MKLYSTSTSPYARKVRVVIAESDLDDRVTLLETTVRDPASSLLPLSPPGKVPVLETDDGLILSESSNICAYLDATFSEVQMFPANSEYWPAVALEGLACGLLEGTVTWVRAMRAPEPIRNPKASRWKRVASPAASTPSNRWPESGANQTRYSICRRSRWPARSGHCRSACRMWVGATTDPTCLNGGTEFRSGHP